MVPPLLAVLGALPLEVMHLGALHPLEKGLTLALAFGPFVVLAVVVAVRRRQDARTGHDDQGARDTSEDPPPHD